MLDPRCPRFGVFFRKRIVFVPVLFLGEGTEEKGGGVAVIWLFEDETTESRSR